MVAVQPASDESRRRNLRTALVLVSVALVFFVGIVVNYLLLS